MKTIEHTEEQLNKMTHINQIMSSQPIDVTDPEELSLYNSIGSYLRIVNEYHKSNPQDFDGIRYENAVKDAMLGRRLRYGHIIYWHRQNGGVV